MLELFRFLRPKIFKLLKPKFNSADLIDDGPSFLLIFIWKKSQPPHNDLPDDLILFFPAFILFFFMFDSIAFAFFLAPENLNPFKPAVVDYNHNKHLYYKPEVLCRQSVESDMKNVFDLLCLFSILLFSIFVLLSLSSYVVLTFGFVLAITTILVSFWCFFFVYITIIIIIIKNQ